MADQSRTDLSRPAERTGGSGETKIEQLLLAGLDHYFAGEYERAISVWTRALFLDRNHARARAYIERARSAIAERQRESEELMHRGVAAFGRGDAEQARELLTSAVERGGPHDVAFAFLDRLDRLQPNPPAAVARPAPVGASSRKRRGHVLPDRLPVRGLWLLPVIVLVVGLAAVGVYLSTGDQVPRIPPAGAGEPRRGPAADAESEVIPVPSPAEIALARARAAMNKGNLKEALRALDVVDIGDPQRGDVDRLRAEIQRTLLSGAAAPGSPAGLGR